MISFRAMVLCTGAFLLIGCSHTLHYTYPPPHPPGQVLDASSGQEPRSPQERPPAEPGISPQQEQTRKPSQMTYQAEEPPQDAAPRHDDGMEPGQTGETASVSAMEIGSRPQVRYWIERLSGRERRTFQNQLYRLDKIRPTIERIFAQHNIPPELSYLCLVESGVNAHAVSSSGATGYWQFIPDTAKKFGLQVNKYVDERRNLEKSTQAAALYLKHLYAIFGDWHLAIAAYNAGEGAVMRLMRNEGVTTFWDIEDSMAIKAETVAYVPKYIATVIIATNREHYGLPFPAASSPGILETIDRGGSIERVARGGSEAAVSGPSARIDLPEIRHTIRRGDTLYSLAREHATTVQAITRANRISEHHSLQVGKTIVIPSASGQHAAKEDRGESRVHRVARGETLEHLSRRYGIPVKNLMRANGITNPRTVQAGASLVIPSPGDRPAQAGITTYTVKKGDTLWAISRQFDVSSADLMKWNRISPTAQIKPGDELTIHLQ